MTESSREEDSASPPPHLPADSESFKEILSRTAELKMTLVDFTHEAFGDELVERFRVRFGDSIVCEESDLYEVTDEFIYTFRTPDGLDVIEAFLNADRNLSEEERRIVLGWQDPVEGVFSITNRSDLEVRAINEVDGLEYSIFSNAGAEQMTSMQEGRTFVGRVVPLFDRWLMSGVGKMFALEHTMKALALAAEIALQRPDLFYRNPENLERSRKLLARQYEVFLDLFGAQGVAFEPSRAQSAYERFMIAYQARLKPETAGTGDKAKSDRNTRRPTSVESRLPDGYDSWASVGLFFEPEEGLSILPDFGYVLDAFDDPRLVSTPDVRRTLVSYLNEESINPGPIEYAAERDKERASQVFRNLLDEPDFDWETDGDALLRKYKHEYYRRPHYPTVTSLSSRLVEGLQFAKEHGLFGFQPSRRTRRLGRNDPCHCGSGRRYRACHGRRGQRRKK